MKRWVYLLLFILIIPLSIVLITPSVMIIVVRLIEYTSSTIKGEELIFLLLSFSFLLTVVPTLIYLMKQYRRRGQIEDLAEYDTIDEHYQKVKQIPRVYMIFSILYSGLLCLSALFLSYMILRHLRRIHLEDILGFAFILGLIFLAIILFLSVVKCKIQIKKPRKTIEF